MGFVAAQQAPAVGEDLPQQGLAHPGRTRSRLCQRVRQRSCPLRLKAGVLFA